MKNTKKQKRISVNTMSFLSGSALFLFLILFFIGATPAAAKSGFLKKTAQIESVATPELKRSAPLFREGEGSNQEKTTSSFAASSFEASSSETIGPNLISNPSFESSSTTPVGWSKGGYGTNNRALTFPVSGLNGGRGAGVSITSYTNGDAKWYFTDVPVAPGKT